MVAVPDGLAAVGLRYVRCGSLDAQVEKLPAANSGQIHSGYGANQGEELASPVLPGKLPVEHCGMGLTRYPPYQRKTSQLVANYVWLSWSEPSRPSRTSKKVARSSSLPPRRTGMSC